MKRTIKPFVTLISILLLLLLNSCDFNNPVDGLDIRLNNISRNTYVSVKVIDATTGMPVTQPLRLTFGGENKDNVININNTPINSITTDDGIALFSLADNIVPDEENLQNLLILVNDNSYISTGKRFTISNTGVSQYEIYLVNQNNLPSGTAYNSGSFGTTNSDGTTKQTISISSGVEPNDFGSVDITIPEGTKMLDANGNVLTGTVEIELTYFSPVDTKLLQAFPGGLNNVKIINEDGSEDLVAFSSAGFSYSRLTVGGTEVKLFEGNTATIGYNIPKNVYNPETASTIKPGDTVPLWSYNPETGVWSFRQNTTVISPTASKITSPTRDDVYRVEGPILVFTGIFNYDFPLPICRKGITIKFISDSECPINKTMIITNKARNSYAVYFISGNKKEYTFRNWPISLPGYQMDIYSNPFYGTEELLVSEWIPNICANTTYTYNISDVDTVDNIFVKIHAVCTAYNNPNLTNSIVVNLDNYPIYAKRADSENAEWFYVGSLENGEMQLCLEFGSRYYFKALYKDEWYYSKDYNEGELYTIDKSFINYNIIDEPDICDDF